MKLYIAGPMTGLPEFNYPAFQDAERRLIAAGHEVESPATPGQVDGWGWRDYMRRGIRQMLDCDGVALLPGWEDSRGASIEARLARSLEMPAADLDYILGDTAEKLEGDR